MISMENLVYTIFPSVIRPYFYIPQDLRLLQVMNLCLTNTDGKYVIAENNSLSEQQRVKIVEGERNTMYTRGIIKLQSLKQIIKMLATASSQNLTHIYNHFGNTVRHCL